MSKEESHITEPEELLNDKLTAEDSPKEESSGAKLLNSLVSDEDEDKVPDIKHWKDIMHAMSIDGQWFKRQMGVIFMVVAGIILYITFRYQAQQEMIEEDALRKELLDWKYRSMTRNSELTLRTRQSQLEDMLKANGDSTLKPSNMPPFTLENE
ncbi:MAG: hypothetical protein IJR87_01585 [Bacteroidaceae bacterium]|nr:hypothetical protein [Bacteroidaceae bacterium]